MEQFRIFLCICTIYDLYKYNFLNNSISKLMKDLKMDINSNDFKY